MWNWATPGERARRAVWVMYKRLTSTRLHKFYSLTTLLTFLPLLTLHLLALHNTSTGLTKLSTLLSFTSPSPSPSNSNSNSSTGNSSSSNSWEGSGSLVPTVIQQDGQGVLRICNLRRDVCESVTAVALSATVSTPPPTSTVTPPSSTTPSPAPSSQAAGSGGIAGDQGASILNTRTIPANSTPPTSPSPSPDVVVQAGPTTRPPHTDSQPTATSTTSSSSSSLVVPSLAISSQPSQQPSPNSQAPSPPISQAPSPPNFQAPSPPNFQASSSVSSGQDEGVLIAAPPPTSTLTSVALGGSSTVPDVPLVVPTTSTSTSSSFISSSTTSTTSTSTSSSKKSEDGNSKQGGSSTTTTEVETSSTTSTSTPTLTSTSTSISSTSSSSPTSESSTENDAINKAPPSTPTPTPTSNRAVSSTDSAVDGHGGLSGLTSTSTTSSSSTSISTSSSSSSTSTSTAPTSTSTDTTSTSSISPDVDSTTDVPTSSTSSSSESESSIPSGSDEGDVRGSGNGGSTSTTSSTSTSTSTTLRTISNSDESTPTGTASADNTSTDSTPTDSTPTETKETTESSTKEPSSSSTDDEPTSTSTPTSSGVPDLERSLSLRRRYTGTLYGSPDSALPAQLQPRASSSPLQSRTFPAQLQVRASSAIYPRTFSATPITNGTNGALEGVDVTDVSDTGGNNVTRLGVVCAISMAFPLSQLRQDWIEDITMAAFYLCILGVGIAAIINESVAHLITAFLSTLLSVLWTSTQLVRTHYAHDQFDAFITRSACSGVDVLPYYWSQRQRVELPILIINVLALVLLGGLGFKLLKVYREDSNVRRYVYKVMLVLRCSILLGSFFLFSGTGIWLNFLFTDPGVVVSGTVDMLKGLAIVSLVFGLPWAVTGWFALREAESPRAGRGEKWLGKRMMMGVFVGLTVLFLAGWVATFASDVYRAVFLAWTFFAVVSVAAFFVLVGSLGAGVVCWMRFGRDLDEFDSEKPRGVSVVSTESFGNPAGHLSHSSGGGGSGSGSLEVPRWDYSNTAEKAWEPFDKASIRQSQFTASDGRESTVFSYGLRSPAPPVPMRPDPYGSSSNPSVAFGLAL